MDGPIPAGDVFGDGLEETVFSRGHAFIEEWTRWKVPWHYEVAESFAGVSPLEVVVGVETAEREFELCFQTTLSGGVLDVGLMTVEWAGRGREFPVVVRERAEAVVDALFEQDVTRES